MKLPKGITTNCVHCGCHKDNRGIKCSAGRHSFTLTRAETDTFFPFPIIADYQKNTIIHDGKTKYEIRTKTTA